MTTIHAQAERKRQDRSVCRAEKRLCRARMLRVRGLIHPTSAVCATTDTARGEKRLPSEQNQAILKSSGRLLGECRVNRLWRQTASHMGNVGCWKIRSLNLVLKYIFILAIGSILCAVQAIADELKPSAEIDVVGVRIGMGFDEVMAQLEAEYPNVAPQIGISKHAKSSTEFPVVVSVVRNDNGINELFRAYFTGKFSGSRVYSIYRSVTYPFNDQASYQETRSAVLEKFGLPTMSSMGTMFQYVFNPERVMLGTEDEVRALVDSDGFDYAALVRDKENGIVHYNNVAACTRAVANVQNLQFFNPAEATGDAPVDCMAALNISLNTDGTLLRVLEMSTADFRFVLDAAKIDQAEDAANVVTPQPTAETPKL